MSTTPELKTGDVVIWRDTIAPHFWMLGILLGQMKHRNIIGEYEWNVLATDHRAAPGIERVESWYINLHQGNWIHIQVKVGEM